MTCGTLIEFCNEDFPIPPRLPPPPPILSYYFEDKINSSFYCEFCANLEASLDPLSKQFGNELGGGSGIGGLFSTSSQNLTWTLFIVALISAAVGSAITVVWRKWFRCRDGGILSKAFGGSHSSHSADISTSPDGRRRSSRTASLGSGSALQNLQKRLSSSSFISRRSIYQPHPGTIMSSHPRSGALQTMSNNTYCECPSSMMMMMCSPPAATAPGLQDGGNNLSSTTTTLGTTSTTSLSPCLAPAANNIPVINPSAPSASTLSISTTGGNVYAELDPVSVAQQLSPPPLPAHPPPGEGPRMVIPGMLSVMNLSSSSISTNSPLASLVGNTPSSNQYVINHRRRQPAPLPPIPATVAGGNGDPNNDTYNHLNNVNSSPNCNNRLVSQMPSNNIMSGPMIMGGVMPTMHMNVNGGDVNQTEMNDLNDIYYSDLDCKQIQF